MPTEHEFKYIISIDVLKENQLGIANVLYIEQGYLVSGNTTVRIRRTFSSSISWHLTVKKKVLDRIIEIEKKLSSRDGMDLMSCCEKKLKKYRYVFEDKGIKWELDFLTKYSQQPEDEKIYFVMLEVEVPEGADRPNVPDFIKQHVLYEVPLTDERFFNKNLTDPDVAEKLYNQLLKGNE